MLRAARAVPADRSNRMATREAYACSDYGRGRFHRFPPCRCLLAQGDEVYVIDDLSTGSIKNLLHNKANPRFHYEIGSVHDRSAVAELVDLCDVVFHLAAAVGVRLIIDSPVHTIVTNVHGTEVLLEQASKKNKKILVASTSEVYGLSPHVPFREDGLLVLGATDKGRWSYACSKAVDEFLALAYWANGNCRPPSSGSSIPWGRDRPANMAWSCRRS